MEQTVVVLFKNALAHYTVATNMETGFMASLLKYGGNPQDQPPPQIRFVKEGRHCRGNTEEADLMDDLYHAVKLIESREGDSDGPIMYTDTPFMPI